MTSHRRDIKQPITLAPITLAIDAEGGDLGVAVSIPGAAHALNLDPNLQFELHGNEERIKGALKHFPKLESVSTIKHAELTIAMTDKPSQALRVGRGKSGMWQAINATKEGRTAATISAGNTGALMAMALFCLKRSAEINRPALAALWPTLKKAAVALDLGASVETDAMGLVHHAAMGAAMARALLGYENPRVALLNIGEEEAKGLDTIQEANKILQNSHPGFTYVGYVEGTGIGQGDVDVIVANGFTGNIALKAAEGTAKQISTMIKMELSKSWYSKLTYLFAWPIFHSLRKKLDPNAYNGAVFLGLDGLVVKSHGNTTVPGYAAAIKTASDLARANVLDRIQTDIHEINEAQAMSLPSETDKGMDDASKQATSLKL